MDRTALVATHALPGSETRQLLLTDLDLAKRTLAVRHRGGSDTRSTWES